MNVSNDYTLKRRGALATNLRECLLEGTLKSRGKAKYPRRLAKYVNCLGHACFGLTNEQIEQYVCRQYVDRDHCPSPFASFFEKGKTGILNAIFEFLQDSGLKIAPYNENEILQQNQRKIAIYFSKAYDIPEADKRFLSKDFHFLCQEADGTWTGKEGDFRTIKRFKTLPQTLRMQKDNPYILYGKYVITNPYAIANRDISHEK